MSFIAVESNISFRFDKAAQDRLVICIVLLLSLLVVSSASLILTYTGVNHFKEAGFITKFSVLQLLAVSFLSFNLYKVSVVSNNRNGSCNLWAIIALGFVFLAADELLEIHENLDHLIHFTFNMRETGLTDRIDDLIVGLYGLIGAYTLFIYRVEFRKRQNIAPLLILGIAFLFLMVVCDVLTNRNDILPLVFDNDLAKDLFVIFSVVEDSAKIFSETIFVITFYLLFKQAEQIKQQQGNLTR